MTLQIYFGTHFCQLISNFVNNCTCWQKQPVITSIIYSNINYQMQPFSPRWDRHHRWLPVRWGGQQRHLSGWRRLLPSLLQRLWCEPLIGGPHGAARLSHPINGRVARTSNTNPGPQLAMDVAAVASAFWSNQRQCAIWCRTKQSLLF